jgi:feruloyl esterase
MRTIASTLVYPTPPLLPLTMHSLQSLLGLGLYVASTTAVDQTRKSACARLTHNLQLPNTTILSVSYVAANTTVSTAGSCQSNATVSSNLCRIYAQVNTSSTSRTKFEMWLPDEYYGRFITVGNGGINGCMSLHQVIPFIELIGNDAGVDYSNLDYTSSLHFAAIGSDNGHDGATGLPLLNQPEVIIDFAWRSIHVSAELGKQIVEHYYGAKAHKNYYLGCSTGGRQGMQSALKFPGDFDGIMAGSPAIDLNRLQAWSAFLAIDLGFPIGASSPSAIPDSLWAVVSAEIIKQCDLLDGVADGIINEPDDCHFDPDGLLCGVSTNDTSRCLSQAQLTAIKKIYSPVIDPNDNEFIYPRFDPLAENQTLARVTTLSSTMFPVTQVGRLTIRDFLVYIHTFCLGMVPGHDPQRYIIQFHRFQLRSS